MISTFIAEYYGVVQAILVVAAIACIILAGILVRVRRGRCLAAVLTGIGIAVVLALTLAPDVEPSPAVECTFQSVTPLGDERNIALFFLPALFAFIAVRRPVVVLLAGIGLSALIELVQSSVLIIGRRCDIDDWLANIIGGLIGVLIGLAALWLGRRGLTGDR